jgi:hypothetical protein
MLRPLRRLESLVDSESIGVAVTDDGTGYSRWCTECAGPNTSTPFLFTFEQLFWYCIDLIRPSK